MTTVEVYTRAAQECVGLEYWTIMEPDNQLQIIAAVRENFEALCFVLDVSPVEAIEAIRGIKSDLKRN